MNKSVVFMFIMLLPLMASGQNSRQKIRQQEIGRLYSEAMQRIARAQEEVHYDCRMSIVMRRNFAGTGLQDYTIDYYSTESGDSDDNSNAKPEVYTPYFIRVRYNTAARKTVKEYLVDGMTGELQFVFITSDDAPAGMTDTADGTSKYETRIYFNKDRSFCFGKSQLKQEDGQTKPLKALKADDDQVRDETKFFAHLMEVYNQTMNYGQ